MEQWKKIEGYDNYLVSDHGSVRNSKTNTFLEGCKRKQGNIAIALWKSGKQKNFLLHRLVAQAFIPNTENKEIVKHRDGDNDCSCSCSDGTMTRATPKPRPKSVVRGAFYVSVHQTFVRLRE